MYRILISAYACEPHKGSEPGVGWGWARQISRSHEVWVITRANNRGVIEEEVCKSPNPSLHFVYLDLPLWLSFWKKGARGLYLYYFLWQIAAYFRARKLHRVKCFDLSHHITFGTNWLPSFLWLLPIPFVWGPIGGFEVVPKSFRSLLSFKWRCYEGLRDIIQHCSLRFEPLSRLASSRAAAIIARTKISYERMSRLYPSKVITILETGVDIREVPDVARATSERDAFTVIMVGRLIPLKGFSLGIRAFKQLLDCLPGARMEIVGSGPESGNLRQLARHLSVAEGQVLFLGQLPHAEVLRRLKSASMLLHPSLKDGGAWVIFEAMAAGLPVVCFDYAGPGEIVTDECGIKIRVSNPAQSQNDFAKAMELLSRDEDLRRRLSQGALQRLNDFLWDTKGEAANRTYLQVMRKYRGRS